MTFVVDASEKPKRSVFGIHETVLAAGKRAGDGHCCAVPDTQSRFLLYCQAAEARVEIDIDRRVVALGIRLDGRLAADTL